MRKIYIDGSWIESTDAQALPVLDPSTGKGIDEVPLCSDGNVDAAVRAAGTALKSWSITPVVERCALVERAADLLVEAYGEEGEPTELKELIQREVGKRLPEADIEVIESSDMLRHFANRTPELLQEQDVAVDAELWPTKEVAISRGPVGVVAAIKAWNYPLEIPLWTIGAALSTGNTVVFKPSEHSSLIGLYIADLFERAGLPPGVLNVITGDGSTGSLLVAHPGVDFVSFTGSVRTGTDIAVSASGRLAHADLELGGNDAALVLADADLDLAANGLLWGAVCNSGQVCVGVKRAYVEEAVADDLIAAVSEKMATLRPEVDFGPLISSQQRDAFNSFIEDAVSKGAKVAAQAPLAESGFYVQPCVLVDVPDDARVLTEECFGPALPIIRVPSVEEAISSANATKYGLGASVWSSDRARARQVAARLKCGMAWINDVNVAFAQVPWASTRGSGGGVELGDAGILAYTQIRSICDEAGSEKTRAWWYPY